MCHTKAQASHNTKKMSAYTHKKREPHERSSLFCDENLSGHKTLASLPHPHFLPLRQHLAQAQEDAEYL